MCVIVIVIENVEVIVIVIEFIINVIDPCLLHTLKHSEETHFVC